MTQKTKDQFSKKEAAKRFEAALKGARLAVSAGPHKNRQSKAISKKHKR